VPDVEPPDELEAPPVDPGRPGAAESEPPQPTTTNKTNAERSWSTSILY
jgi:hypothetical protein